MFRIIPFGLLYSIFIVSLTVLPDKVDAALPPETEQQLQRLFDKYFAPYFKEQAKNPDIFNESEVVTIYYRADGTRNFSYLTKQEAEYQLLRLASLDASSFTINDEPLGTRAGLSFVDRISRLISLESPIGTLHPSNDLWNISRLNFYLFPPRNTNSKVVSNEPDIGTHYSDNTFALYPDTVGNNNKSSLLARFFSFIKSLFF